MADDVPIIIGSDDEDSDSDDVVLIKEEIEVEEDSDDVIFLSETKATPLAENESKEKPELVSRSHSLPADNLDLTRGLNRSVSITTCAGQLSLDDGSQNQGVGPHCDNRQLTTINHTSGPLDLSSKACDNLLPPSSGASDTTATNIKDNSLTLAFGNINNDISAVAINGVKNDATFTNWLFNMDLTLSTAPTACPPVCTTSDTLTSRGTSADLGYSDITVLPGGIITSTAMLPLLGSTTNPSMSVCTLNNSPFLSSPSVICPPVTLNSQTTAINNINNNSTSSAGTTCITRVTSDSDTMTSVANNVDPDERAPKGALSSGSTPLTKVDTCTGGRISGIEKMDVSPPVTSPDRTKQFLFTPYDTSTNIQKPPAQPPQPQVKSVSADSGVATVVSISAETSGTSSVLTSTDTSQAATSCIGTATVTSAVNVEAQSSAAQSLSSSSVVSLSTSVTTPVVSTASPSASSVTTEPASTKNSTDSICTVTSKDTNAISSNDVSSTCDPFAASHNLFSPLYKLNTGPLFSKSGSDKNSAQSRTILQYAPPPPVANYVDLDLNQSVTPATPGTSQQSQLPVNTSVGSGVTQSACCSVSGLPGGSSSFVPYCVRCSTPSVPMCKHRMKTSISPTTKKLYNPLTLPVSMQASHMRQSLSFSALQNCSSTNKNAILKRNSLPRVSDHSSFPLPPKKQKRCFNDSTCVSCRVALEGEKSSRCPNGHMACAKCLEEKVKLVLTGKTKESVRCLNRDCDSFYPVSELKLSLPSMVVEILEDKLDQEYVDYISDMMLKNASNDIDQSGSSGGSSEGAEFAENKRNPSLPDKWTAMDERTIQKKGYEMVKLEPDMQEYNKVVLLFFQSMVDQNVEVTAIHRVQNPIQWKYYRVKKSELQQDNEGYVQEKQLFHGTSSSVVEAICRRGFDWRVCGKHGTLYGQGSYFAVNASYSHQYTDLRQPRQMSSSMMLSNPMSMTLPTTPSLIYPPVNVNFGQPLTFLTALNLSNNNVPGSTPVTGSSSTPSASISGPSVSSTTTQRLPMATRLKVVPMNSQARSMSGHPSAPLLNTTDMTEKATAKVFLARVLVGRYVKGHAKLRKPPPLYPREDPFGKCFDSCVDDSRNPKIFVIFDSAQAYPEYLLEYTYSALTEG